MIMEHPKQLKIRDILLLEEYGLEYKDYLFIKEDYESATFINKNTKEKITLRR